MAKATTRSSEMNVYTVLLVVASLVLLVGVGVLAVSNMSQAEAGGQPGSPLNIVK
jgi:hypothetical protein